MNILKLKSSITNYLFVIAIFSSYSLFKVSNFYMQIVFICMIMLYFLNIYFICFSRIEKNKNVFIISACFISYLLLNCLLRANCTITSLFLICFYFGLMFFTYRYIEEKQFNKIVNVFIRVMTVLAVYGIYQFFARKHGLPFSDLKIPGHMVSGFNWSNQITIGSNVYSRSNAICLEPSFFSQYLAINIGFLLVKLENNYKNYKIIFIIIINFVALVMSFSGTGILLLIFILLWYIIENFSIRHILKYTLILIFVSAFIILICLILNKLFNKKQVIFYFFNRIKEFNHSGMSGSVRFRQSYINMIKLISENPMLGNGIGSTYNLFEVRTSTIARIISEIGIIGITLWILFLASLVNKNNIKNHYYVVILIFIFLANILGENFGSAFYWAFIYLINCKIVFNSKSV